MHIFFVLVFNTRKTPKTAAAKLNCKVFCLSNARALTVYLHGLLLFSVYAIFMATSLFRLETFFVLLISLFNDEYPMIFGF